MNQETNNNQTHIEENDHEKAKLQKIIDGLSSKERSTLKDLLEFPYVKEDVTSMLINGDSEEDLTDDEIEWVASQYVFEKRYDCNKSYWENLMSLIDEAVKNRTQIYDGVFMAGPSDEGFSMNDIYKIISVMDRKQTMIPVTFEDPDNDMIIMGIISMEFADELDYQYGELQEYLLRQFDRPFMKEFVFDWKGRKCLLSVHENIDDDSKHLKKEFFEWYAR